MPPASAMPNDKIIVDRAMLAPQRAGVQSSCSPGGLAPNRFVATALLATPLMTPPHPTPRPSVLRTPPRLAKQQVWRTSPGTSSSFKVVVVFKQCFCQLQVAPNVHMSCLALVHFFFFKKKGANNCDTARPMSFDVLRMGHDWSLYTTWNSGTCP